MHGFAWGGISKLMLSTTYIDNASNPVQCGGFMINGSSQWDAHKVKVNSTFLLVDAQRILSFLITPARDESIIWEGHSTSVYNTRSRVPPQVWNSQAMSAKEWLLLISRLTVSLASLYYSGMFGNYGTPRYRQKLVVGRIKINVGRAYDPGTGATCIGVRDGWLDAIVKGDAIDIVNKLANTVLDLSMLGVQVKHSWSYLKQFLTLCTLADYA
ncbi:hypothetical protein V6N12_046396 [Hibiscus sabdariffa]|uniref:rRNA N-glycosidase n=1 Tax=Hibiscus sabdariffa TaxID=183260 RepID=A0ABR2DII1_9ROSI